MEQIGRVLANLSRGTGTLQIPIDKEPTREEKREALRKNLGLSSLDNTFENFKLVKGTAKALTSFKALAYGKTHQCMLLCYGGVGNGKTHLCEATAIEMYKRGLFVRVMTMSRMMMVLKAGMNKKEGPGYDWLLSSYCLADRLIIDDVGMGGSGSDWEYGQLEDIMIVRYRERLFTIITTNRDITELPERIISRFRDPDVGTCVLNQGEDYRRLKDSHGKQGGNR